MNETTDRLLPTLMLYKPLDSTSFEAEKSSFFTTQCAEYAQKSLQEKWNWIQTEFCKVLSYEAQCALIKFMHKREKSTKNSEFVLNKEQCLDYLERFYFLYMTDSTIFALSSVQKKSMVYQMCDVMKSDVLCDIRTQQQFENILIEFRADKNWIDIELLKARYLMLVIMHEAYNHEFDVYEGNKVHTLATLQDIAEKMNLGITQQHQIKDVYSSKSKEKHIKEWFKKHSVSYLRDYEKNSIKNLSLHVLIKMGEFLNSKNINTTLWDKKNLIFPKGYYVELKPQNDEDMLDHTIYLYLQELTSPKGKKQIYAVTNSGHYCVIMESERMINRDPNQRNAEELDFQYTEAWITQGTKHIKNAADLSFLKDKILSYLSLEPYCATLNEFHDFLKKYLDVENIQDMKSHFFVTSISEEDEWILKSKPECLAQIEICLEAMLLKKNYFISKFASDNAVLSEEQLKMLPNINIEDRSYISELHVDLNEQNYDSILNDETNSRIFLQFPFVLLRQTNPLQWSFSLPERYKANPIFMHELFYFCCEWLTLATSSNQENLNSMLQQFFILFEQDLCGWINRLPRSLSSNVQVERSIKDKLDSLSKQKEDRVHRLKTDNNINLYDLVTYLNDLSPLELKGILQERVNNNLPFLPYCENLACYQTFCDELSLSSDWVSYNQFKIELINRVTKNTSEQLFLDSNHWFVAYMRYSHHYTYFNGVGDILLHVKQIPFPITILTGIIALGLAISLTEKEICYFGFDLNHPRAPLFMQYFMGAFVRYWPVAIQFFGIWYLQAKCFGFSLAEMDDPVPELKRLYQRLLGSKPSLSSTGNVLTDCQNEIIHLEGMDNNPEAWDNAKLLEAFLGAVTSTHMEEKPQEKVTFSYKNTTYQLSFWDLKNAKPFKMHSSIALLIFEEKELTDEEDVSGSDNPDRLLFGRKT